MFEETVVYRDITTMSTDICVCVGGILFTKQCMKEQFGTMLLSGRFMWSYHTDSSLRFLWIAIIPSVRFHLISSYNFTSYFVISAKESITFNF
jgi:hypothetical protein